MAVLKEQDPSETASALVSWLRFLLPFAIGAIGLYVGLIIAPMDTRLRKLETTAEQCRDHMVSDSAVMNELIRRIGELEKNLAKHKESDHNTFVKLSDMDRLRVDLKETDKDLLNLIRGNTLDINTINRKGN